MMGGDTVGGPVGGKVATPQSPASTTTSAIELSAPSPAGITHRQAPTTPIAYSYRYAKATGVGRVSNPFSWHFFGALLAVVPLILRFTGKLFEQPAPSVVAMGREELLHPFRERLRSSLLANWSFYIAVNLYNNEDVMPQFVDQIATLANFLGPSNVYFSAFENGSKDRTVDYMRALGTTLTAKGVGHSMVSGEGDWRAFCKDIEDSYVRAQCETADCESLRKCPVPVRIAVMAVIRNKALEPLLAGKFSNNGADGVYSARRAQRTAADRAAKYNSHGIRSSQHPLLPSNDIGNVVPGALSNARLADSSGLGGVNVVAAGGSSGHAQEATSAGHFSTGDDTAAAAAEGGGGATSLSSAGLPASTAGGSSGGSSPSSTAGRARDLRGSSSDTSGGEGMRYTVVSEGFNAAAKARERHLQKQQGRPRGRRRLSTRASTSNRRVLTEAAAASSLEEVGFPKKPKKSAGAASVDTARPRGSRETTDSLSSSSSSAGETPLRRIDVAPAPSVPGSNSSAGLEQPPQAAERSEQVTAALGTPVKLEEEEGREKQLEGEELFDDQQGDAEAAANVVLEAYSVQEPDEGEGEGVGNGEGDYFDKRRYVASAMGAEVKTYLPATQGDQTATEAVAEATATPSADGEHLFDRDRDHGFDPYVDHDNDPVAHNLNYYYPPERDQPHSGDLGGDGGGSSPSLPFSESLFYAGVNPGGALRGIQPRRAAARHLGLNNPVMVIFLNDVILYAEDVLELILTEDGHYDMACGTDFERLKLYDTWVARDMSGATLSDWYPYLREGTAQGLLRQNKPFRVFSCWNGGVVVPAAYIVNDGITFRTWRSNEARSLHPNADKDEVFDPTLCPASECTLFCKDLWEKKHRRIFMNPRVKFAYNYHSELFQRVVMRPVNALLLSWINRVSATHHSLRAGTIRSALGSTVPWMDRGFDDLSYNSLPLRVSCGLSEDDAYIH